MKSSTEKNLFQLDTGTVQELFQKDIKKNLSDSEDDFDKRILQDQTPLHGSYSLISIESEAVYDEDLFINVATLLKPEGIYPADEYDRENITRFGLETIVEEMHDQTEDAVGDCGTELDAPKSGLIYEEYEIDLGGQTSEELHRSEEFQRLLTLLSKPKGVNDAPSADPSEVSCCEKGPNILIETTTNRKVECTLKEVKNTKYYLKGDGRVGSVTNVPEGVPSEGDCRNYEVKGLQNPSECPKIEHPCMSQGRFASHEASQSETVKPRRSSGRSKSGKSEKRNGSKKCSKSGEKKRKGWVAKCNFTSVTNTVWDRVRDFLQCIHQSTFGNQNVLKIIGDAVFKVVNFKNVLASVICLLFMLVFLGALFYKPPGLIDMVMHRLGKRRTPFQTFYDTILTLLYGIIR